ncbi:hypothetical protein GGF42_001176 [Coemansia sp. RSA 2424]|nr:hypothetical protein GGF42_001176 [Coemansia sp. RSA 2424]
MLASDTHDEQTLGLCPSDSAVHLLVMAPLYFEKPQNDDTRFMDFEILKTSFHRTLATCLPHALGTNLRPSELGDPATPLLVTVSEATPQLPMVTKHVDDECTIAAMRVSGFIPHVQPRAILERTVPIMRNPMGGGDPLVTLDVVYMSDGVGVLLVLSHAVVDMAAYCRFVGEWAQVASSMSCGVAEDAFLPRRRMDTDRGKFWALVSEHTSPNPYPFEKHLEDQCSAGSVEPLAVGGDMTTMTTTVFRLSADVEAMGRLALTRDKLCPGISVLNFVSALLWQIIARAESTTAAATTATSEYTYFSASLTIRKDTRFAEYWGNTATVKYIHARATMIAGDLGYASELVQKCVREFGVSDFAYIVGLYTRSDQKYIQNLGRCLKHQVAQLLSVTNLSRVPFYGVDFGFGGPVKAFYQTVRIPGLCFIMPRSVEGGIEIFVCLRDDGAAKALVNDEMVQRHFDVEKVLAHQ